MKACIVHSLSLALALTEAIGISGWFTWLTVPHLAGVITGPHRKQQPEHLNSTVMAFITDQGLTSKLNGKELELVEVIVPSHCAFSLCLRAHNLFAN